jgi:hypothetical protein
VKDQYVGDISDFEKYSILRALGREADLPLAVCWMLTVPDGTGESRDRTERDGRRNANYALARPSMTIVYGELSSAMPRIAPRSRPCLECGDVL